MNITVLVRPRGSGKTTEAVNWLMKWPRGNNDHSRVFFVRNQVHRRYVEKIIKSTEHDSSVAVAVASTVKGIQPEYVVIDDADQFGDEQWNDIWPALMACTKEVLIVCTDGNNAIVKNLLNIKNRGGRDYAC